MSVEKAMQYYTVLTYTVILDLKFMQTLSYKFSKHASRQAGGDSRVGRQMSEWASRWVTEQAGGSVDRRVGRQALAEAEIRDRATHTGPQGPALQNVVPTTLLLEIAKMLSCLS